MSLRVVGIFVFKSIFSVSTAQAQLVDIFDQVIPGTEGLSLEPDSTFDNLDLTNVFIPRIAPNTNGSQLVNIEGPNQSMAASARS